METHPTPLDHRSQARRLMRASHSASLATIWSDPQDAPAASPAASPGGPPPYASLVTVACDHDGSPILLLSKLADHTRNIVRDPRVALLFEAASGLDNPQTGPRVTVMGRIVPSTEPRHRDRFLARHPGAAFYAGFADFAFYRVEMERFHFVGGFARALWFTDRLTCPVSLAEDEAAILAHMNADHAEAVDLYARILLGQDGGGWRMTAIDAEGLDLTREDRTLRLAFDETLRDAAGARALLARLAAEARNRGA